MLYGKLIFIQNDKNIKSQVHTSIKKKKFLCLMALEKIYTKGLTEGHDLSLAMLVSLPYYSIACLFPKVLLKVKKFVETR